MKTILQHKKSRRLFGLIVLLLLVLIFLIRVYVVKNQPAASQIEEPMWHALVVRLLDSLFVSLFVGVLVGSFLLYVEGPDEGKKFDIIEAMRLEELFNQELSRAEKWSFTGGMGRHTRSKTLPHFDKTSRSSNQQKTLKISIIDPTDELTCSSYACYRRDLRSGQKQKDVWTKEYVQREILSTIVTAAILMKNNSQLDIEIKLKNTFSTLRIDLSERTAIVTKEDKKESALVCREGSFLFNAYKEETFQTYKLHRPLSLAISSSYTLATLTAGDVEHILSELALNIQLKLEDYADVSRIIKENKNPYA